MITLRLNFLLLLALLAAAPTGARAQWSPTGAPVCGDSCVADAAKVLLDGAGGVYVGWRDLSGTDVDAYAQRLTAAGTIAPGWRGGGLPVSVVENSQEIQAISSDGAGGLLLVWFDGRNKAQGNAGDIYAQRVLPDGTIAPGWPVNGAPVARAPYHEDFAHICSDGGGGAFVAWASFLPPPPGELIEPIDVYAQHLLADGSVAPGWAENGLPVCVAPEDQIPAAVLPDGTGCAIIVWDDGRSGNPNVFDVYAQHLLADGTIAPGWVPDGNPVVLGKFKARVAPDEAGGFYVGCSTPGGIASDSEYYVQRFTFAGTRTPGWPEGGVLVCSAPDLRNGLDVAPDGSGGLLLTWFDTRLGTADIFATRVLPDGSLAPGWTPNGVQLSVPVEGSTRGPQIVADGTGGAYVAWERNPVASATRSLVQHLGADGSLASGWPIGGVEVATTQAQFTPQLATDDAGGAIVVWEERSLQQRRLGLYAQRFHMDGPVAVLVSLVRVNAAPDRVALVWHVADAASFTATVERRSKSSEWQALGTVSADGTGRIEYQDRGVSAGERYAYRLAYAEDGAERHSAETWVEVPRALALALEGLPPNPAVRELAVSFTLPAATPAVLELLDVSGRRVVQLEVGSLGVGRHMVRLNEGTRLPPGIYWLRLTQGARSLLARSAVIR